MAVRSFRNLPGASDSDQILQYLSDNYGSADFKNWQRVRQPYWSFMPYPEAGVSQLTFFGNSLGQGTNTENLTNMPKAGSLGQRHYVLKQIKVKWYLKSWDMVTTWGGADNDTLVSDILNGFVHTGELELNINQRMFVQLPKPQLYAPPSDGRMQSYSAGVQSLTISALGISSDILSTAVFAAPMAALNSRRDGLYIIDPEILIEAEQSFNVTINWPTGLVPIIGTDITDDTTNPLYIGVVIDGEEYRPLQ